jgi:hypothetical protein
VRALAAWGRTVRRNGRPWETRLFDKQQAIFRDRRKRLALLCSRRAGKTDVIACKLIEKLLEFPHLIVPYITRTSKVSKQNLWAKLQAFNRDFGLGLREVETLGMFKHPKGGYIWLTGCKDLQEAEKFRGPHYPLVVIDEAGTFRASILEYLIDNVLDAALTDVEGELWLSGTPGVVPSGYFWERTTGEGRGEEALAQWPTYSWTVADNPHHVLSKPGALEEKRAELGLSPESPKWLREYCGKWALDTTALIYYCDPTKNHWDGVLPEHGIRRITLGVDIGYEDETAFVVCASIWGQPTVYVMHAHGQSHMLPSAIAEEIKRLVKQYGVQEIYMDSGGLAKTIMIQLQTDYHIPVGPAEKHDKVGAISRVRDALDAGTFKLDPIAAKPLVEEWNTLVWHIDLVTKERKGHHPGMADHNADALLYAYRPHLHQRTPETKTKPFLERENDRIKREAIEAGRKLVKRGQSWRR